MADRIKSIGFLGIPIDNLNMPESIERIFEMVDDYKLDEKPKQVATVNVDFIVNAYKKKSKNLVHPELLPVLRKADLVVADGMPIVWASKLLGSPLKERVTGSDMTPWLIKEAAKRGKSIYLLGGKEVTARDLAGKLEEKYPSIKIAGYASPFIDLKLARNNDQDMAIINEINKTKPDILLIALGNPKQEIWFRRNIDHIKVPVSIGVGATFEFMTGELKRAPKLLQKAGLEWIFRILQEPNRLWKRYAIGLYNFGLLVSVFILRHIINQFFSKLFWGNDKSQQFAVRRNKRIILPATINSNNALEVQNLIRKNLKTNLNVELDFSQIKNIDLYGIGMLLNIIYRGTKENVKITKVYLTSKFEKVLRIYRCQDVLSQNLSEGVILSRI